MTHQDESKRDSNVASGRRRLLKLGAVAAPAVLTLKSAAAQTVMNSMTNCFIPITQQVDGEGNPEFLNGGPNPAYNVDPGNGGSGPFGPPSRSGLNGLYGQEALQLLDKTGRTQEESAYLSYISQFTTDGAGLSCVVSINFPIGQIFTSIP